MARALAEVGIGRRADEFTLIEFAAKLNLKRGKAREDINKLLKAGKVTRRGVGAYWYYKFVKAGRGQPSMT